jgi:hypothetical protein
VELSGRMASVLMAIPSVFAEAGFATGAGVSGALAVVGCGVSGFLSPHILFWPSSVRDTYKTTGAGPGCESMYLPDQNWNKRITGVVFLKVTQAGGPARRPNTTRRHLRAQEKRYRFNAGQK